MTRRNDLVERGLQEDPIALLADVRHFVAGQDLAAAGDDVVGVRLRHLTPVHDAGLRREDTFEAGAVRLDLLDLLRSDHSQAGDAVGSGTIPEVLETG